MLRSKKLLMSAAAAALLATPALAERGSDGQLNILYWQAPSIQNPYLSGGTKDIESSSLVLEPLAYYDETGSMVPALAVEIPTTLPTRARTAAYATFIEPTVFVWIVGRAWASARSTYSSPRTSRIRTAIS